MASSNKHVETDGTRQVIHIITNNREISGSGRLLTLVAAFQGRGASAPRKVNICFEISDLSEWHRKKCLLNFQTKLAKHLARI